MLLAAYTSKTLRWCRDISRARPALAACKASLRLGWLPFPGAPSANSRHCTAPSAQSPFALERRTFIELAGHHVDARIHVKPDGSAQILFNVGKKHCNFDINRWAGDKGFMLLFHAHESRDAAVFGTVDQMRLEQCCAAVARACEDVMVCFRQICNSHGRGALDYAVWYRDSRLGSGGTPKTYKDYVQLVTCEAMAQNLFVIPGLAHGLIDPMI